MFQPRLICLRSTSLPLFAAFGALMLASAIPARAQAPALKIDSSVTLVMSASEPGPVHRATQDLQADFAKVFGRAPKIVNRLDASGPVALVIAQSQNVPAGVGCTTSSGMESFAFSTATSGGRK